MIQLYIYQNDQLDFRYIVLDKVTFNKVSPYDPLYYFPKYNQLIPQCGSDFDDIIIRQLHPLRLISEFQLSMPNINFNERQWSSQPYISVTPFDYGDLNWILLTIIAFLNDEKTIIRNHSIHTPKTLPEIHNCLQKINTVFGDLSKSSN